MANGNGISSVEESSEVGAKAILAALPESSSESNATSTAPSGGGVDAVSSPAVASPPIELQRAPTPPPPPSLLDQVETLSEADREKLLERLKKKPEDAAPAPPAAAQASAETFARKVAEVQGSKNEAAATAVPPKPPENEDLWRRRPREMAKLRPPFYVWTREAIEKSKYEFEVEPGKKEWRYRPVYGLMLQRFNQPGEGVPSLIFMLFQKVPASDVDGRIVEAEEGRHILVSLNHGLRQLLPVLKSALELGGVALVSITPTGYHTFADGTPEMTFDAEIEADPSNPRLPRIFSRESALGELKKNFEALR